MTLFLKIKKERKKWGKGNDDYVTVFALHVQKMHKFLCAGRNTGCILSFIMQDWGILFMVGRLSTYYTY